MIAEVEIAEGDVHGRDRPPGPLVDRGRDPDPDGADPVPEESFDQLVELLEQRLLAARVRRPDDPLDDDAFPVHDAAQELRPAEIHRNDPLGAHNLGLPYRVAVASKDKPYRVYRGGRARGSAEPLVAPPAPRTAWHDDIPGEPPPAPPKRRRRRWLLVLLGLIVFAIVVAAAWGALGYLAFRSGIEDANARLDGQARLALTRGSGSLVSSPRNLLLIGADSGAFRGPEGGRSDALILVRTDPDEHRLALLSIPRDLRVEIPGRGQDKINAAYALGGAALAIRTVENLTGLGVHHVVVVDFATFPEVIDALGGVTIDVPKRIVSNRFDCPFSSAADCQRWPGWRFAPGKHTMDGRRALVYARIRENELDPTENDLSRGGRQQQVVQALADQTVSLRTFFRLPFVGDNLVKPLATDLSAWELMQLGWVKFRAAEDGTLRCRLGGTGSRIGDADYIIGAEENVAVMAMFEGKAAPQPPSPASGPFAPGCTTSP